MSERLSLRGLTDPFLISALRRGPQRVVKAGNQVAIQGSQLDFPAESAIADGTEVEVRLSGNGWLYAESVIEMETRRAEQAAISGAEEARISALRAQRDAENRAFNRALPISVPWGPAIKDVLSGLSERSMGDGANTRTVTHVRLKEPLQTGRLTRAAGDFLCTSQAGSNGRGWSNQADQAPECRVTCKSCLRLAEGLRNRINNRPRPKLYDCDVPGVN